MPTSSDLGIKEVCRLKQLQSNIRLDLEIGNLTSAVVVLQLVVEVLDDLFQNVGADLLQANLTTLLGKLTCTNIRQEKMNLAIPEEESIDLMVPETQAAALSTTNSLPSLEISFTFSVSAMVIAATQQNFLGSSGSALRKFDTVRRDIRLDANFLCIPQTQVKHSTSGRKIRSDCFKGPYRLHSVEFSKYMWQDH